MLSIATKCFLYLQNWLKTEKDYSKNVLEILPVVRQEGSKKWIPNLCTTGRNHFLYIIGFFFVKGKTKE